jgi:pimeloyl-ACP methyl ester carboxylesterase
VRENQTIRLPDGRTLGFSEFGDPQGQPMLYCHGWPSSRIQARGIHQPAADRGLRVIAPDRPGIGLSDPLPGRGFSDWPADVGALADALAIDRFALLGFSGGGPYALACAALLPDRLEAVGVVCGAPPLDRPADRAGLHWTYRTLASVKHFRQAVLPPVLDSSRWMINRGHDKPPLSWLMRSIPPVDRKAIERQGAWEMVSNSYLEAIRNGPGPVLEEGELYLEPWDFDPATIRIPTMIWHGTEDRNLPCELARRLAARIPRATTRWVEGSGHYSLAVLHIDEILDELGGSIGQPVRRA